MSLEACVVVIVLSLLSVATTAAGVALALRFRRSRRGIAFGIGFSTGIMLLIACLELLPEAAGRGGGPVALLTAAAGAGVFWVLHLAVPHIHLFRETAPLRAPVMRSALLVVAGLVLHDLPEGFAMAQSYIASPSLGIVTALGIALHNLPEEFAMAAPVAALRLRRMLYVSALISALAEPMGAILGLVASGVWPDLLPLFLAFAAGAMGFVSLHELLPMARRYRQPQRFAAGMAASLLAYGILSLLRSG